MKLQCESFLLALVLVCGLCSTVRAEPKPQPVVYSSTRCEGTYPHHLQGICVDGQGGIFWSFTTQLVKTNASGKLLKKIPVGNHHGDLCYVDGKVYVAVNFGDFNNAKGNADSWVYVYDAEKLLLIAKHKTPEVIYGAGGIAHHNGKFLVVGGLPQGFKENYLYEYDQNLKFVKKHVLKSGYTLMGIQTATFADNQWWFGCYDPSLLKADTNYQFTAKYDLNCSLGIERISDELLLIGGNTKKDKQYTGEVLLARPSKEQGFIIEKKAK